MNIINKSNKLIFFNNVFKLLFVAFWIIFWFIGIILTENKFNQLSSSLSYIYSSCCILFIISYIGYMLYTKSYETKIEILYKITTILAFIFSSLSYYLFPLSIFWFFIKLLFLFVYMYVSAIKLHKYKSEEGVVGIICSALMIFMFIRY